MDACITSLLGGDDVEVIIINDGSTDSTATKANSWAERHPETIRVIHQDNAGHGGAVMAGLHAARGVYTKVVDSDDWLDLTARDILLATLRRFRNTDSAVDLVVTNYVYEHVSTGTQRVIRFRGALPTHRTVTWDHVGRFGPSQNILMHAAVFRTEILRRSGLDLPRHTFYVDNLFVYIPMPFVKTLHYLPVDLYRYFIGREDQSVNEKVMTARLDQQIRVTNLLAQAYKLPSGVPHPRIAQYMEGYLAVIVAASSMLAVVRGDDDALRMREEMWNDLKAHDAALVRRLGRHPIVLMSNIVTPVGRRLSAGMYRVAQRYYRFN